MSRPLASWPAAVLAEYLEVKYGGAPESALQGIAERQAARAAAGCACGGRGVIAESDGPADWCTCEESARLLELDPGFVSRWNKRWIERTTAAPLRAAMATALAS